MTVAEQTQQEETLEFSFGCPLSKRGALAAQFYSLNPKLIDMIMNSLIRLDKIEYKSTGNIYFHGVDRETNKEIINDISAAYLVTDILGMPSLLGN